jgi:hypothetical protein
MSGIIEGFFETGVKDGKVKRNAQWRLKKKKKTMMRHSEDYMQS